MRKTPLFLALCFVGAASFPASAQSPSPSPQASPHHRFETVVDVEGAPDSLPETNVTPMKIGTPIQKTPASVSVVPASLVEDQGGSLLQDAMKNVTGVTLGSTFGIFDTFVVRGFDSISSGLLLFDGAAEPESTQYPMYNLQRVEVLKGPGAFVYGGSPLSSAIHLVRKQPQNARFADFDFSAGSFSTWDLGVDLNAAPKEGQGAFRLNAYTRSSDSWRDGRDQKIWALNPSARFTPTDRTRIDLNLEYLRSEYQPDSGIPVSPLVTVDVPRSRSYASPLDSSRQNVLRLRADADWRITDQTTLHGKIYFTDLDWDTTATIISGITPPPLAPVPVVNRSLAILDDRQKLLGNQIEAVSVFEAFGARHRLFTGWENSRLTDRYRQDAGFLPVIGLDNPIETAQPPASIIPGFSAAADATAWVSAPYFMDRITVSDQLEIFAGGRLDILDYEDAATSTKRDDTRFSPSAGIVVTPVPNLSFYAMGTSGFAPASSTVPGPRDPETSRQFEVGSKTALLGGRGLASAAVYDLRRRNVAIPDANGLLRQAGDQRSRGFELDLRVETGLVSLLAGYAFTDATLERFAERVVTGFDPATFQPTFTTFDRSGNTAPYSPRHLFNFWGMRRVGDLEAGIGLRLVGKQFIGEDNASVLDSYGILDAMVAYRFGRARFVVNLHNLTDKEYFTRGFGNTSVIPGGPFAAYARVEVGFGAQ